jgi:hypothetical protein
VPGAVVGAVGQRQVHRAAQRLLRVTGLLGETGTREQGERRLVHADGEHAWVVVEGGLDAVAVVHVEVDVGDALVTLPEQPRDRDGRVVEHAEA